MAKSFVQRNGDDHLAGHSHVVTELNEGCEVIVGGHIERAALEDRSSCSVPEACW